MKRIFTLLFLTSLASLALAQVNCDAYKYMGDTLKYEACKEAEKRAGHYQFSYEYQHALDNAIEIDSTFSNAYKYKSTAYLKAGNFLEFMKLMDKAVELDPEQHLIYRGWCRFQFFRDYKGAIQDIELLDSLADYDIGFGQNGFYHLQTTRALCYKKLGQPAKAISILETKLKDPEFFYGPYFNTHLGVLYLDQKSYSKAEKSLLKQQEENDLAENRYYLAKVYQAQGRKAEAKENLEVAKEKYVSGMRFIDPYGPQVDKIYMEDIEKALANLD